MSTGAQHCATVIQTKCKKAATKQQTPVNWHSEAIAALVSILPSSCFPEGRQSGPTQTRQDCVALPLAKRRYTVTVQCTNPYIQRGSVF